MTSALTTVDLKNAPVILSRGRRIKKFGIDCGDGLHWRGWYVLLEASVWICPTDDIDMMMSALGNLVGILARISQFAT